MRAVRPARALRRGAAHRAARRRPAHGPSCDARGLPEGALLQRPRPVQRGVRAAAAVALAALRGPRDTLSDALLRVEAAGHVYCPLARPCYVQHGVDRPAGRHAGPALPASTSSLVQHGKCSHAQATATRRSDDPGISAVSETRKLAAILVSDVVGYSRLAGADEDRTLARLRTLRSDLIDPIISVHHGHIIKRTGDGSILEFRSVVDAVRCALEVQTGMVERNAGLPAEKRIEFRIGIHLGDVVEEADGDLMGDGVNVAARLEGICEPGGVCLSEDAYRQVKSRLELQVADLGPQSLKNIAEPVRAFLLRQGAPAPQKPSQAPTRTRDVLHRWPAIAAALALALLAAGAFAWRAGYAPRFIAASVDDKLANAPRLSIVVVPFENLSGDKEQDYFADAITDDLTTDLSHLRDAFVISRGTAFTYKGKPVDAKAIGRELGVRYLLEGSVRRVGETITVNAQLISTETGAHVWADRFDGERSKLGELQVEAVSRLANSLGVELVKAEALRAMRERPSNPDAVDLAMQAEAKWNLPDTKENLNDEVTLSERALALDPQNARALYVLASALVLRVWDDWSDDPAGDIARAEKTIDTALALQPENSWAHYAKGQVYAVKRQWRPSIAEYETVIALDPNNAPAHAQASYRKEFLGRAEEGLAGVETALRLSPRDPSFVPWWQLYMCDLHNHLAHWEQAIEWCSRAAAGMPQVWYPLAFLAAANAWAGHDKEAKEVAAQLQKVHPGFTVQTYAGMHLSDDPTFNAQFQRIVEGLRKAGVPEGEQKTN
jgi:adenylate cyclase